MHQSGSRHVTRLRLRRLLFGFALVAASMLATSLEAAWASESKAAPRIIFDVAAEPSWTHTIPSLGAANDYAIDVKISKAGAVYVAGCITGANEDVSLMKYVDGAPAWAAPRIFDSVFHQDDTPAALALGPEDVVYVAGSSEGAGGDSDVLLIKYSKTGRRLWTRRYDGPAHNQDWGADVGVDKAGNVTVAAVSLGSSSIDCAVVSWTSKGERRWVWRYDGAFHGMDALRDLHVAAGGTIYATGYTQVAAAKNAMLTIRLSAAGKKLWTRRYAGPADAGAVAAALVARPGGGVYVAGSTLMPITGPNGLAVRYTAAGVRSDFTPDTGAGGATNQSFADIALASTKQVVAVGEDDGNPRVVVYTPAGAVSGALNLPSAGYDYFSDVTTDAFGGYYVTGTGVVAPGNTKVFSGRGSVITGGGGWLSLWGPAFISGGNHPSAVAARGTTAVIVGTCVSGPGTGSDQFVLGYLY